MYFTGSISSFGNLFWSLNENRRVWLYVPKDLSKIRMAYLLSLRDCGGSLCHFENGKLKRHICTDIPQGCIHLIRPEEYFFKTVCVYDYDTQLRILGLTRVCNSNPPCLLCSRCVDCNELAEMYGMYDAIINSNSEDI